MSIKSLTIKNNTGSAVTIADVGIVIGASSQDTFSEMVTIRKLLRSADLLTLATDATPTLTLNDGTSDIEKATVSDFIQWFDTGRSSTRVIVDPAGNADYLTIEEALGGLLEPNGSMIALVGGDHDVDSVLDVSGITFVAISGGTGRANIRAQTGGQLEIDTTVFRGVSIEVPSTTGGFSGTFFIDVLNGGNEFIGCTFNPAAGKSIFGCDTPVAFASTIMRYCGQSGSGVMVDSGSSFTSPFWICIGENFAGVMEFDADDVYMDDASRANTTTGTLIGIPNGQLYIAPGERLQVAIDSIGSVGGGTLYLLPGDHTITTSLNITDDDVNMVGIGKPTIKNNSGTWVGGTTANDAMLNIGTTDGTTPNEGCKIEGIRFENDVNIHGIQVNGGERNSILRCQLISTTLKTSLRVGILFTDGSAAAGKQFRAEANFISSTNSSVRWVDGIHMDGNNTLSTYGYGNGIFDSIVFNNIVEYAGETCYVFVDVNDSSIFTNRASDVCYNAGGIGLAMLGCVNSVCTVNSIITNNNAGAGAGMYVYGCNNCIVEQNSIDGGATAFPIAISVLSNSDLNVIGGNTIDNCTTGLDIASGCSNNRIRPSIYGSGVTTCCVDADGNNAFTGVMTKGTGSPNGSVTGRFADQYLDTNNNITYICISYPNGTSWRITAGGWIGQQTYYVGKHGNDSNTGLSMQDAKLTFGSAITAAVAQTPASNNIFSIVCDDAGRYSETLTMNSWVHIDAPNATLVGSVTLADDSRIKFRAIEVATGVTGIAKTAGTGTSWVDIDEATLTGTAIGVLNTAASGVIIFYNKKMTVDTGFGVGDTSSSAGHMHVFMEDIYISGSGGTGIARIGSGTIVGSITHILEQGAGVGNGTAIDLRAGTIDLFINDINANVAYTIAAGATLNLHICAITGTETVAATGVANITYSGTDIPRGTSFPSQPVDGRFWYRTDDDHLYRYDSGRSKWLGELDWDGGGRSGTQSSNSYFRRFNGMPMSATLGTYIPYDITIVGITWAKGNTNSGTIEVRRNGVLAVGVATGAASNGSDLTLNTNFSSGGIFSLYWNSANSTTNVQIKVYYRRLQT